MINKIKEFMSNQVEEASEKKSKKKKEVENIELQKEIETLKAELDESKDKYLRLFAEFDNFKKRSVKERFELMKTAAQETITALLPVLDDFDRAKKSAESGAETFSEGVQLVYQKLYSTLEHKGLKSMESTGADFDPEWHEAITDIPAPSEEMKGKIIDTVEKGYVLSDKIIRYAKVVVAK
ncbi:MAG: nucleotide exchange factor GrpE [Saprospiraceae bacterium]|jgi:molecular chaperone GrpE|nr:nucleotide exchange factor GrpE [Saprospiraceae bacterium]